MGNALLAVVMERKQTWRCSAKLMMHLKSTVKKRRVLVTAILEIVHVSNIRHISSHYIYRKSIGVHFIQCSKCVCVLLQEPRDGRTGVRGQTAIWKTTALQNAGKIRKTHQKPHEPGFVSRRHQKQRNCVTQKQGIARPCQYAHLVRLVYFIVS